jgi:DNA-binding PadR family transcriptional regulator
VTHPAPSDTATRSNPTEFAILGLLAEAPRSGYDIKKEVEGRLGHFWSESYGHIYPMLRRLHSRGLVEKEVEEQSGRPDRHVYRITAQGQHELTGWFAAPPVAATRTRNELLLRLFLGRHASPEHLVRDVAQFREGLERELEQLRSVRQQIGNEADNHPERIYWDLVLDYGLTVFGAMAEWGRRTETTLKACQQVP